MGRSPCCAKVGLNRGAWTAFEDKILTDYIQLHGEGKWKQLPKNAGLKRCGKSCRLRWLNYLRPDIKRGNISEDEEELIVRLHKLLGNRWSLIAGRIPGRTDNEIKNYWNTNLSKKASASSSSSQVATPISSRSAQITKPKSAANKRTYPSSSQVFRTKATRCTKVFVQPQPQAPPPATTNNVIFNDDTTEEFVGHSLFSSSSVMPEFSNLMGEVDDDLGLADFCLTDFLNTDCHNEFIINTDNEADHVLSGAINWSLDGHENQEQRKQSSVHMGGTDIGVDQNHRLFSLFVDSFDTNNNWDI